MKTHSPEITTVNIFLYYLPSLLFIHLSNNHLFIYLFKNTWILWYILGLFHKFYSCASVIPDYFLKGKFLEVEFLGQSLLSDFKT